MNTGELQAMQRAFQQFLLGGEASEDASGTLITDAIVGTSGLSASERLTIYNNAYYIRLIEFIHQDYPVLLAYLEGQGKADLFSKLARAYVEAYPARHFAARFFSRNFSHFLSEHTPDNREYAEFAAFEWAIEEALWAANAPLLHATDLESLAPEDWLKQDFQFHPSVRAAELHYNIPLFWQAFQQDKPFPELEKYDSPKTWLIWRTERAAVYQALDSPQAITLFRALQAGNTFGEVCLLLAESIGAEAAAGFVGVSLEQWLCHGLFVKKSTCPL